MFTPPPSFDPFAAGDAAASPIDPAQLSLDEAFAALKTTRLGLSSAEAARRLAQARQAPAGKRARLRVAIPPPMRATAVRAFAQIADPLHLLLLASALASVTFGAPAMAVAIVVLTALRVLLLAAIETYANAVCAALREARGPRARVRREGAVSVIDASALAVGDVIELAAGSQVPADVRLFDTNALVIDQSPVPGDAAMAWAGAWVTRGSGAGIVTAVGSAVAGAALGRLQADSDSEPAGTPEIATAPVAKLDRANAVVLAFAIIVFLAGVLRGPGMLHNVLAAVTLAAMAWSARTRLAQPLLQLAAARAAQRLMAAGVFVRELDGVERLAAVPADGTPASDAPPVTLTSAGTDDTDRARQAADVVFNAPAADIARLAPMATLTAREAAAGADRALAFGRPTAIALLLATALFAFALLPTWPASVPLGLHVLLFGMCIALARTPAAAGTTAAPTALDTRAIDVAWGVVLLAASLVATRLARQFSVDTATLAFATFALGSIAFAWLATAVYRRHAWALRRPAWGQTGDVVWLAFATAVGLAATVAAVHLPRWQSAFETAALTRATWGIATGLVAAAIAALLVFMLAVQWVQTRRFAKTQPAAPSVAVTEPPAAAAVTAATNALAPPTEAPAPPANP